MTVPVFVRDAAERAIATYLEVFLGLLIAANVIDLGVLKSAALAAIPAALSVVKSALAANFGEPDSASLDPKV